MLIKILFQEEMVSSSYYLFDHKSVISKVWDAVGYWLAITYIVVKIN